jgi:uncharacterized lipoprotein YbaY
MRWRSFSLRSTGTDSEDGDSMKTRVVRGEIVLPTEDVPTTPADVAVYVEDVSRADAPAAVVGEQRRRGVALRPGESLPFEIEIPADRIDERGLYSVRVHIDHDRSGDVTVGDFVSTQSYPVLTRGHGTVARVGVKRV